MGYFQVRYDSRVVNYDRRGFIRLATEVRSDYMQKSADSAVDLHQWRAWKFSISAASVNEPLASNMIIVSLWSLYLDSQEGIAFYWVKNMVSSSF